MKQDKHSELQSWIWSKSWVENLLAFISWMHLIPYYKPLSLFTSSIYWTYAFCRVFYESFSAKCVLWVCPKFLSFILDGFSRWGEFVCIDANFSKKHFCSFSFAPNQGKSNLGRQPGVKIRISFLQILPIKSKPLLLSYFLFLDYIF